MGRELKRVALDFKWPLKQKWKGYVNPYSSMQCKACDGEGSKYEIECTFCNGEGEMWSTDKVKKEHEEWVSFEPPTGEGFQLWETTSEGSPISPVFANIADLCEYAETNCTIFGHYKLTKEEWAATISDGPILYRRGGMVFI